MADAGTHGADVANRHTLWQPYMQRRVDVMVDAHYSCICRRTMVTVMDYLNAQFKLTVQVIVAVFMSSFNWQKKDETSSIHVKNVSELRKTDRKRVLVFHVNLLISTSKKAFLRMILLLDAVSM
ncbi:hypothetical protein PoB_006687400 [Plakobranchus ocellatus]|uniref:Uncharacterized protein n=1 Tax=Plakobranchus ocellatus TaxID=259542 RepID=A0AAV4D863_9GAST|nr:hypothetical protein PoB_006687400 [Plakobranchus ocellatus]